MPALEELRRQVKHRGLRLFILDYQYHAMFASLAIGFICVGAYIVVERYWFLSRLILLLTILVFVPAAVVVFAHLRETLIGHFLYWDPSNRLWTRRRSPKTEKIEVIILTVLWLLICLLVVYAICHN